MNAIFINNTNLESSLGLFDLRNINLNSPLLIIEKMILFINIAENVPMILIQEKDFFIEINESIFFQQLKTTTTQSSD